MLAEKTIAPLFAAMTLTVASAFATDVLTYHNDNARDGWNPNETILTPSNVNSPSFGLKFNLMVDGKVDAQPLYVSVNPVFSGGNFVGNRDLIVVATENDSVYVFDGNTGALYGHVVLLGSGETPSDDRGCGQVTPEIGITATPVIDRNNGSAGLHGTIYVVAMSKSPGPTYHQRLYALDLATGQEVGVQNVQPTFPGSGPDHSNGTVMFDPAQYKERAALLLLNGIVYTAFSSHCDIPSYTGWMIGYDEKTLAQTTVLNVNPNGGESGNSFWSSGDGPAADSNGNIFALTANGPFDTNLNSSGFPSGGDYGDTFLKVSTAGGLHVVDYFTPDDANDGDNDLGSGGALVLPDMLDANNNTRHLAVGAGKDANIYLVDRDNMAKFNPNSNGNIYQQLPGALGGNQGEFGSPAYFGDAIYYGAVGRALLKFTFSQARLNPAPAATTTTVFQYPGTTPSISSSGNSSGIVWAYENSGSGQAVLHAYDASDLHELYNSDQNSGRDQFGLGNKFITPTICNGKVLVATTNSVGVFGLLNPVVIPQGSGVAKDFDNNASADLLWENSDTGEREIWLMDKGTPVVSRNLPTVDPSWHIAGVGDFIGNGQSDLVWESTNGDHLIWIMNAGVPQFALNLLTVGGGWHVVGAGDFDNDGQADLVWENSNTGEREIWLMNNGSPTISIALPTVDPSWHIAGVGDFLGNRQSDLVWENMVTGERVIWLMNGATPTTAIHLGIIDPNWHIAGAGDFLGTGQAGLVWENLSNGQRLIWAFSNGQPTFSISLPQVPTSWHIVDH
ncbi:MAG: VCBS repeat-containing protein [Verrucomicrobia bacterium]|nr:VCBS repeat-containing protein [Verrucomicrobiota bacterium]